MKKTEVLEYFGGVAKTARAMRLTAASVYRWPDELTDLLAYRVELATKGALKSDETLRMIANEK
jgi:predicted nucleotidyltransferase